MFLLCTKLLLLNLHIVVQVRKAPKHVLKFPVVVISQETKKVAVELVRVQHVHLISVVVVLHWGQSLVNTHNAHRKKWCALH